MVRARPDLSRIERRRAHRADLRDELVGRWWPGRHAGGHGGGLAWELPDAVHVDFLRGGAWVVEVATIDVEVWARPEDSRDHLLYLLRFQAQDIYQQIRVRILFFQNVR